MAQRPPLEAVTGDSVLHHAIHELPALTTYVAGTVVPVGDAAHAITPDLGQGAALGLEDAAELGDAWIANDLATYARRRRERAALVGRHSARIGAVGQWHSHPAAAFEGPAAAQGAG